MTSEICSKCGKIEGEHRYLAEGKRTEEGLYCKDGEKFEPQNHSPQTSSANTTLGDGLESSSSHPEDKELEESVRKASEELSSGSDDEFKDIRWKDESLSNWRMKESAGYYVYPEDKIKEFVKKLKDESVSLKDERYYEQAHKLIVDKDADIRLIDMKKIDSIFGEKLI